MALVLVVDDDKEIRDLLSINLGAVGNEVLLAQSGQEALDLLSHTTPDLIILDVMMPELDGFEVLEQLKSSPDPVALVPVIMLTGRVAPEDRFRGGVEGAIVYITKPFDPEMVLATVERVLADPRSEREQRLEAQRAALESMARMERTGSEAAGELPLEGNVRLTRLERKDAMVKDSAVVRISLDVLTVRQRELLDTLSSGVSVAEAAEQLEVSRSNVYATLQRISRAIGVANAEELLTLVRRGVLR